ncbi:MAG TPA: hypothetical protein ENO30_04660 [Thermodesulfobium narugense]|nr:hypothetical protein [Thermodesulfobium narugense]
MTEEKDVNKHTEESINEDKKSIYSPGFSRTTVEKSINQSNEGEGSNPPNESEGDNPEGEGDNPEGEGGNPSKKELPKFYQDIHIPDKHEGKNQTDTPDKKNDGIPISVAINNMADPVTRMIVSRVPRHLLGSYCNKKTPGDRNDQKMCLQSIKEAFKESAQRSVEEWQRQNSTIEMHRPHELGILTLGLDGLMNSVHGFVKGFMNDAKLAWKEGFYRHVQRHALIRAIKRLDLLDDFHEKKFMNYANVMNEREGAALYKTVLAKHGGDEAVRKIYTASKGSDEIVQNMKKDFENMTVRDMVNHAVKHAEPADLQHILHAATRIILEHGGIADYSVNGDISKYNDPNVASFEGKMAAVNLHDKLNDDSMKGKLSFDHIANYLNDALDVKQHRGTLENTINLEDFRQFTPAKRIEAIDSPAFPLVAKIAHMRHLMTVLDQNGKGAILDKPISSIKTHQEVEHHLISDAKRFIKGNLLDQSESQDTPKPTDMQGKSNLDKVRDILNSWLNRGKKSPDGQGGSGFAPG